MPDSTSTRALRFHQQVQAVVLAAVRATRQAVRRDQTTAAAARSVGTYQLAAATLGARTMAREAGRATVANPVGFVGRTAIGYPIEAPLQTILDRLAEDLEASAAGFADELLASLDLFVAAEVADAARGAASVEIAVEPDWTNYVRVLNPPSCDRCAILAGRIYRDIEGFARHPLCDCVHWPVEDWETAHDMGLVSSPMEAFEKDQITGLSKADAQAIRDGADIIQVVNAKRGMRTTSVFGQDGVKITTAGTTRRSAWRRANPNLPYRLRPESIYDLARDYDDLIRLLKLYGYIL